MISSSHRSGENSEFQYTWDKIFPGHCTQYLCVKVLHYRLPVVCCWIENKQKISGLCLPQNLVMVRNFKYELSSSAILLRILQWTELVMRVLTSIKIIFKDFK